MEVDWWKDASKMSGIWRDGAILEAPAEMLEVISERFTHTQGLLRGTGSSISMLKIQVKTKMSRA